MSFMDHARVFLDSWSDESRRRKEGRRGWTDTDFLPAALEITETPPSPIGRWIIWTIIAAALVTLIWSCLAHVDTVAVAEGRLVPEGRLRSVEAAEQGVIRRLVVKEGQHVTKGQPLIYLDPTIADAEASTARNDLATARLTTARDNALLAFAAGRSEGMASPQGAANEAVEAEGMAVQARIAEYRAKVLSLDQRRVGATATARATQAEIDKLQRTLPLLREALDLQEDLARQGFGARQKLLQQRQAYVTAQADLVAQHARLDEARAQAASLAGDAAQAREEFVSKAAQERAEAEGVIVSRGNVVREADQKQGLHVLTAPVSGTVQEVMVTNIGEVPEVGKPLVTIIPDGEPLVVEALLLNRDAGFIRPGMKAVIKLEAYPFTRYGVLHAVVERVSPDSTVDQKRGLVFPVRLRITGSSLKLPDGSKALSPGMSASAEIVTGTRTVIEYLWSPIARSLHEAGREN
jgi:hemolysin D